MSLSTNLKDLYRSALKYLREANPYALDRTSSALIFIFATVLLIAGRTFEYRQVFGLIGLVFILGLLFAAYVWRTQKDFLDTPKNVMISGSLLILFLMVYRIFSISYWYLIPLSALALMTTNLLGHRIALIQMVLAAAIVSLSHPISTEKAVFLLVGGLIAIMTSSKMSSWRETAKSGIILSASMAFVGLTISLASNFSIDSSLRWIGMGLANGLEATILVLGAMPVVEAAFNLATPGRLLDLSNPNQHLMKELFVAAPGTYSHSILVGNIAEAAAQSICANSLLARVGAYYHDIGKMKRPDFFIENQIQTENPHDKIKPRLSSIAITAHVKDGVEIARENRLPKEVVDIIREHHGTGLVSYFFNKAKDNGIRRDVSENDYRYASSKPKSKEAAIVMISDSLEAAVRADGKPTLRQVKITISEIIKNRMEDGQLSDSGLTFEDLDKISKSFEQSLVGFVSNRVADHPDSNGVSKKGIAVDG